MDRGKIASLKLGPSALIFHSFHLKNKLFQLSHFFLIAQIVWQKITFHLKYMYYSSTTSEHLHTMQPSVIMNIIIRYVEHFQLHKTTK